MAEPQLDFTLFFGDLPDLDKYVRYVTGSTPRTLADEIPAKIARLPAAEVQKFIDACCIAATSHRRFLEDYIAKETCVVLLRFLREEYWIDTDHVNYTALNMAGHCMMAAEANMVMNNRRIRNFRAKMNGAKSIWQADLNTSTFSDEQKRIYRERVSRSNGEEARECGNTIINALLARRNEMAA